MSTLSLSTLAQQSQKLTAANSQPDQAAKKPPTIAAQDPFLEPVFDACIGRLPAAIRERLQGSRSLDDVDGALAAAAVYELLASQPALRTRFFSRLELPGASAREVALSLAQAYGELHYPPTRSDRWHALDLQGLAYQLTAAAAIWIARGLFLAWVASTMGCLSGAWWNPRAVFDAAFALPFLGTNSANAWYPLVLVGIGLCFALEAVAAPRLMEEIRVAPAKVAKEPAPESWREDTFAWAWRLFCFSLAGMMALMAVFQLVRRLVMG